MPMGYLRFLIHHISCFLSSPLHTIFYIYGGTVRQIKHTNNEKPKPQYKSWGFFILNQYVLTGTTMLHKNITIITFIAITLLIGILYKTRQGNITNSILTIGILQTASHPALDEARNGFVDTFKKELGEKIHFVIRNAEGSIIAAHTIAQQFHNDQTINAIYAIATPALQAAYAVEKEKPIFIAAVSNPEAIIALHQQTNVCGTTDMIDIPGQIKTIKQLLPHITSVAIIYNPAEANSIAQVNIMKKELYNHHITPFLVGIISEAEITTAVTSALAKADALLAPTDNVIASAMPIISHLARIAHKPLIASHNPAVKEGALMARGVDYYTCGAETAKIALEVLLHHKKPHEFPIHPVKSDIIVVNQEIINELAITIPKISDKIIFVTTQP